MSVDPATGGYWEVAVDGGIFSFGAQFFGSKGNVAGTQPVVGMSSTRTGLGYSLADTSGGVYGYGDAACGDWC
jgi:hypothetical protein